MDIEKLIVSLRSPSWQDLEDPDAPLLEDAAHALSTLQAENERLKNKLSELAHFPFDEPGIGERTRLMAENAELRAELEQVKRERDAAVKTIFKWTGCPECKYWNSADEWCEKHDREADSCGECDSPEWRGPEEE